MQGEAGEGARQETARLSVSNFISFDIMRHSITEGLETADAQTRPLHLAPTPPTLTSRPNRFSDREFTLTATSCGGFCEGESEV